VDCVDIAARFTALGARVVLLPLIRIVPMASSGDAVRGVLSGMSTGDWLVFSSPNAVRTLPSNVVLPNGIRVASVGPGTSSEIRKRGWRVDLEAPRNDAEGLAAALGKAGVRGKKVLLPQSTLAGDRLSTMVAEKGASETAVVESYVTVPDPDVGVAVWAEVERSIAGAEVCSVVLASPSAVDALTAYGIPACAAAVSLVAIGSRTAGAMIAAGLEVAAVAERPTDDGMVAAVTQAVLGEAP